MAKASRGNKPKLRSFLAARRLFAAFCVWQTACLCTQPSTLALVAPNELLGTCLDEAWAASIAKNLSISATDRDSSGTLVNPYLHGALSSPRFRVDDKRTARARGELFQSGCMPSDSVFYGVGARVDDNGQIIHAGRVNGTLVMEIDTWSSHSLSSMLVAILAQESVRAALFVEFPILPTS
ncbi:hypothetical protein PHYPSEUDO_003788 [Phytophthora pseudosyringae]|uniref:Uncharacterized protein n=1 Tax=Phytophthora pseudosyringae TaxID=221518 RepID=A0A8T1WID0_9STRA|nr:hypothetical protein PHYPSEUDO_003788 [Phytophthora pseudosyringae]